MQSFKAVFLNEMERLVKRKKFLAVALVSLISIALGQVIVVLIKHLSGINVAGASVFPMLVLSVFSYSIIPLFGVFAAADLFAGEFSSNTMKLTLSRPVSRFKIFTAKVTAAAVFVASHFILTMALSVASSIIASGFKLDFMAVFIAYTVNFFPVFVFVLLAVLLSNILKGPTSVFMVSILAYIVLWVLGVLFSSCSSLFIVPLFDWFTFFTGSIVNIWKILRTLVIILSMGGLLFSAGYFMFEKRKISG